MTLIGCPINLASPTTSSALPYRVRIAFLFRENITDVVHSQSVVRTFVEFNATSTPRLFTEPMLSIIHGTPDSTVKVRCISSPSDSLSYQSTLPLSRLLNRPKSSPTLISLVFSHVIDWFTGLPGAKPVIASAPKSYHTNASVSGVS